ncbi:MAG: YqgE/AlgH family protein [Verrucomicrobiales bacterium]|nr:YqgE/AlgH family protein [Verrucomicrobiales bacterium]
MSKFETDGPDKGKKKGEEDIPKWEFGQSLRGKLILADPRLTEPMFHQSVLLLTEHSEEYGALGYILNRPIGKTVGELLPNPEFSDLENIPVFMGGPVSTEHLTFSAIAWSEYGDSLQFVTHLSASEALMHQMEGFSVRAFVGYSGWSEGQLEDELKQDAWITRNAEKRIVELTGSESLWKEMLRDMGPWHRIIADEPEDLGLN